MATPASESTQEQHADQQDAPDTCTTDPDADGALSASLELTGALAPPLLEGASASLSKVPTPPALATHYLCQLPRDALSNIVAFLGHVEDVLRVSTVNRVLRGALAAAPMPLVIHNLRQRPQDWCGLLDVLWRRCPTMASLALFGCNVTDASLCGLTVPPRLQSLLVWRCYGVGGGHFPQVPPTRDMPAPSLCPSLSSSLCVLGLVNAHFPSPASFCTLLTAITSGGLPNLTHLLLGGARTRWPHHEELAGLGNSSRLRVVEATYWPREERALLSTLLLPPSTTRGPIRLPTIAENGKYDGTLGRRTMSDFRIQTRNSNEEMVGGGLVVDLLESPVEVLAAVFDGPFGVFGEKEKAENAEDVRRVLAIATVCTSGDQRLLTPLHVASMRGEAHRAEWLLTHGAEVNARGSRGNTPLLRAAGQEGLTRVLLAHGADVWCRNQMREGTLYRASLAGDHTVARLLVEHLCSQPLPPPTHMADDEDRCTAQQQPSLPEASNLPPHPSSSHGTQNTKDKGTQEDHQRDERENTQTQREEDKVRADQRDQREKENFRVDRWQWGTNPGPTTTDGEGFTPLHAAVIAQSTPTLTLLLHSGLFNVDAANRSHETALHLVARTGSCVLATLLLDAGANVDGGQCPYMPTPLNVAIQFHHTPLVELLASHGATTQNASRGHSGPPRPQGEGGGRGRGRGGRYPGHGAASGRGRGRGAGRGRSGRGARGGRQPGGGSYGGHW